MSSHNTYEMWFETETGEQIKAFTWTGSLEAGMQKVYKEAPHNGYTVKKVWGVPVISATNKSSTLQS